MDQKTDVKPGIYEKEGENSIEEIVEKPSIVRKRTNGDAYKAEDIEIEVENDSESYETASDEDYGYKKFARYEGYIPYTSELMSTIPKTKLPSLRFEEKDLNT